MKEIKIAFDIDWTLIRNDKWEKAIIDNYRIVELLKILSTFKNTEIIVWSGRWKEWAEKVCKFLCITPYIKTYASKNHKWKDENWKHIFEPDIVPDIAIDDIQSCELWIINLICKEK